MPRSPFPVARNIWSQVRPARQREYAWGPVTRQRDRTVSLNASPEAAIGILNCWVQDADTDFPTLQGRPGFVIADESMGATAPVQWAGQLSKAAGTEVSAVIAAGEIWAYTWATDTLTKVVSTANLTTATITLSPSARVYACEFADTLVFNDGVNQPFTWDGTSGAGGLTLLSNAPTVCYGKPWVYVGKLWFIKNAERSTVVWSEEGEANTGYEAGGYANAWTLRQTATEGFYAGEGTNEGLVLWRGNSTTLIVGDVTPNFSSTATDEAISETVGCRSPGGVLNLSGTIYFLSSDRRVLRLAGRSLIDVGIGARARLAAIRAAKLDRSFVEYVDFGEQGERILVAVAETSADEPNGYIVINPATGLCEGAWTGWLSTALGRWKNADGEWRLVHGGGDAATTVDDGLLYIHDVPNGSTWNDEFLAGESAISHGVETTYIGPDANVEQAFLEGTLILQSTSGVTGVSLTVKTPRGDTPLANTLSSVSSGGAQWGVAVWGTDVWGDEDASTEHRLTFATRGVVGRHARLAISHAAQDERFGLLEATMVAVPTQRRPTTR